MKIWADAQLSPSIASWLSERFNISATAIRDLSLHRATDEEIFRQARQAGAVVLTKDADFQRLLERHGPPPQVVWITCGNTSNARLREVLERFWPAAQKLLEGGEPLVETHLLPAIRPPSSSGLTGSALSLLAGRLSAILTGLMR